jgi:hypothetical protein
MITKTLHRRLAAISQELTALGDEGAILAEQLAFAHDLVEQTRLRALVAETPLSDRDLHMAADDLRRIQEVVSEANGRTARLLEERDQLLQQVREGAGVAPLAG